MHTTLATAHDVGREYRVIHTLGPTPVPVPEAYANCVDESVIGAPFYVMEYVDGIVLHDFASAERLDDVARHRVNLSVVDAQVALHAVDIDAVGLGDLAKREDCLGRQLRRWYRQYEAQKTDDLPGLDTMYALLTEKMPEQRDTAIVHGDLRSGNCMIDTNGEVLAVLDWEICTLGDPLADIGYLLATSPAADDEVIADQGAPSVARGFAAAPRSRRADAERSGRDLSQVDYYIAFSHWKLACILQGVMVRSRAGAQGEQAGNFDFIRRRIEAEVELAEAHAADL